MNFIKSIRGRAAGFSAAVVATALPVLAHAQAVSDPFDTALTTVTGKVNTYAAALVGVAAVSVVFMVAVKYVKKLPKAS